MKGYKTYFLSALAVLWAIVGFALGNLDATQATQYLWAGLTVFAVRNAIR